MKITFLYSAMALLMAQLCFAGFKVPKSLYTVDKLDEAKAEAAEEDKSLLILYTDPAST